jgi:hypothetical protein
VITKRGGKARGEERERENAEIVYILWSAEVYRSLHVPVCVEI